MLFKVYIKWLMFLILALLLQTTTIAARNFTVYSSSPRLIDSTQFNNKISGGDTIFIDASRTTSTIFNRLHGDSINPIVIINKDEVVTIDDKKEVQAIEIRNCKYVKLTGTGSASNKYGFKLSALNAGISVSRLSSFIEIENIAIDHEGFFGITAKEDYDGNPPYPIPVFNTLIIHDCFVTNVTEGFYIGETKTPGMEFKHLKLYNNIITNTGREGIQIANATEDVEIHNNLMYFNGTNNETSQANNLQIGDNSVAEVYNNIIIGAPDYGIISFGKGYINIYSNYIEDNKGIFIDNRTVSETNATIEVSNNIIANTTIESIVKNFNKVNQTNIFENIYDTNVPFYISNNTTHSSNVYNNTLGTIKAIDFKISENGDYLLSDENPSDYELLGPSQKTTYNKNNWPNFSSVNEVIALTGQKTSFHVLVSTLNNDMIAINYRNMPDFITTTENGNGKIELSISPNKSEKGIYKATIIAKELSHNIVTTKEIEIIVRNESNKIPEIKINNSYTFNNQETSSVDFKITDEDNDPVTVTATVLPSFVKLIKKDETNYTFSVTPNYSEVGTYEINLTADDGYKGIIQKNITLNIEPNSTLIGQTLYRINYGGPSISDTENTWSGSESNYVTYNTSEVGITGSYSWSGSNNTDAPDNLFGPCIYSKSSTEDLKLTFKCAPANYKIRLLFADKESYAEQLGSTIMDIYVEDSLIEKNFNITKPDYSAIEKIIITDVKDSLLQINLKSVKNKAKIYGIEISINENGSTNKTSNPKIAAYPNPFISRISIANNSSDPINSVDIYTLTGKQIYHLTVNSTEADEVVINTQFILSGAYLIKIGTKETTSTQIIYKD